MRNHRPALARYGEWRAKTAANRKPMAALCARTCAEIGSPAA